MGIQITAKRDGFRRCGIAHSKEPKVYPGSKFSKKEVEILNAEPMLTVIEVEDKIQEKKKPEVKTEMKEQSEAKVEEKKQPETKAEEKPAKTKE